MLNFHDNIVRNITIVLFFVFLFFFLNFLFPSVSVHDAYYRAAGSCSLSETLKLRRAGEPRRCPYRLPLTRESNFATSTDIERTKKLCVTLDASEFSKYAYYKYRRNDIRCLLLELKKKKENKRNKKGKKAEKSRVDVARRGFHFVDERIATVVENGARSRRKGNGKRSEWRRKKGS